MHRHRLPVLAFASVLLLGGAGACSSSGSETSTVSTVPTTAEATTTTVATTVATTQPATTTTGAATTEPPTTAGTTTTTTAAPAATTPEAAAKGLYAAWKAGDETAASAFADQAAIDTLFARTYTGPDLQFIGCEPDGDVFACTWYYEGGAETYRAQGSPEAGYRVVAINQLAD